MAKAYLIDLYLLIFLFRSYKLQYLQQSPTRIGRKYKKVRYTLYNESFTERIENMQRKSELGLLGPVIRAQVRDVIKVRPHSSRKTASTQLT